MAVVLRSVLLFVRSCAEVARRLKDERCFEWMERFVRAFETQWKPLIDWYSTNKNQLSARMEVLRCVARR
jgi:hypothetical protein